MEQILKDKKIVGRVSIALQALNLLNNTLAHQVPITLQQRRLARLIV